MTRPSVVVLSSRTLYAEGVMSRLKQHAGELELQMVDARLPDALAQIVSIAPSTIIIDATDAEANQHCPLDQLLKALPELKVICLDPQNQGLQVVTSQQHHAKEIQDLIAIINQPGDASTN